MATAQHHSRITLLDGGMGRELMRMGAPFRQPEWSALALTEAPDLVRKAHQAFAAAGSDILTTSNYAVAPFHLGKERFLAEGKTLTALAGHIARDVASSSGCRVAGSIPPLSGSYRPDLFIAELAQPLLAIIIDALKPSVDLWLAETISSLAEAEAVATALSGEVRPLWLSFTLMDGAGFDEETPCIRSGEKVTSALRSANELGASAILFNCSQPEVMSSAITAALKECRHLQRDLPIGVYANAFPPQKKEALANSALLELRQELDPAGYLHFAETWCQLGVTIIGGCCGIGPEHIASLHGWLRDNGFR